MTEGAAGPRGADDPDDDDLELAAPGVRITKDHACTRMLSWRVTPAIGGAAIDRHTLVADGWVDDTVDPRVEQLHYGRHRLVVIPATARIQLRLGPDTPAATRPATALELAARIAAAAGWNG